MEGLSVRPQPRQRGRQPQSAATHTFRRRGRVPAGQQGQAAVRLGQGPASPRRLPFRTSATEGSCLTPRTSQRTHLCRQRNIPGRSRRRNRSLRGGRRGEPRPIIRGGARERPEGRRVSVPASRQPHPDRFRRGPTGHQHRRRGATHPQGHPEKLPSEEAQWLDSGRGKPTPIQSEPHLHSHPASLSLPESQPTCPCWGQDCYGPRPGDPGKQACALPPARSLCPRARRATYQAGPCSP